MLIDFKIQEDDYGYYVLAYRIVGGVEIQFDTLRTLATMLNLSHENMKYYISHEFNSDEQPKNDRLHFVNYDDAIECREGLRALIPKAIETGNLYLAE